MAAGVLKAGDRVKRANATGARGTVREVRTEVTASATAADANYRGLIVTVNWDNGTFSYFGVDGLTLISE